MPAKLKSVQFVLLLFAMLPTLNILVLYDKCSTFTTTVREYLESFSRFSRHRIHYLHACRDAAGNVDFNLFDVVILHYSIRLCYDQLSLDMAEQVRRFQGHKVFFVQDEYDLTEKTRLAISDLGIHTVFTCVPEPYIQMVYPPERFPKTEFINAFFTGYASTALEQVKQWKPLSERQFLIGYRGRQLSSWYGNLAREKFLIGARMGEVCKERGLPCDIETDDKKRIYGDGWFDFLGDCRATLGTESGASVFDDDGSLRESIILALEENPALTYEEIHRRFLADLDGKVRMNQVSPKIFEAIALKTALVLFEGEYSGVVQPNLHYIPLKKDFSNIEEVLAKVQDDAYLMELTERAYNDVIASGRYSYRWFVETVDAYIDARVTAGKGTFFETMIVGHQVENGKQLAPVQVSNLQMNYVTSCVLSHLDPLIDLSVPKSKLQSGPKKKLRWHKKVRREIGRFVKRKLLDPFSRSAAL